MSERVIEANGCELWTEDFGDPAAPCVLLVMGATAQGILWPEEFCEALAAGGRHVIRYDNRDTGQSTCFDFSRQPYTLSDMARDAVGVLDAYGVPAAHVVGASMGGMIGQVLALEHRDRVLTLTLIMSSPASASIAAGMATGAAGALPGLAPRVLELMAATIANPPTTDAERIEAAVRQWSVLAGSADPPDEALLRAREARVLARARNIDAAQNHALAMALSPDRMDVLGQVDVPTLVIHGTDDPILPLPHGEALAALIKGARLLPIEGMGHDLPPRVAAPLMQALLEHTA